MGEKERPTSSSAKHLSAIGSHTTDSRITAECLRNQILFTEATNCSRGSLRELKRLVDCYDPYQNSLYNADNVLFHNRAEDAAELT